MSDEEKRVIKSVKEEYKKGIEQGNVLFPIFLNQAKILLNLIEKQQKEIEELKEQCKEVVCVPEGTCFIFKPKDINKKWEDKIKAKIEFIKSLKEKLYYEENVISILQSLLEKE